MRRGLWIGTGIAIGIGLSVFVGVFTRKAYAKPPQTEPKPPEEGHHGPVVLGTGGSTANQNDVCWVLFRDGKETGTVKAKGGDVKLEADRYVLAAYRVKGEEVSVVQIRNLTWDVKLGRLAGKSNTPEEMFKTYALEKMKP